MAPVGYFLVCKWPDCSVMKHIDIWLKREYHNYRFVQLLSNDLPSLLTRTWKVSQLFAFSCFSDSWWFISTFIFIRTLQAEIIQRKITKSMVAVFLPFHKHVDLWAMSTLVAWSANTGSAMWGSPGSNAAWGRVMTGMRGGGPFWQAWNTGAIIPADGNHVRWCAWALTHAH